MCFSATASFSSGVVLLGVGTLTLKAAQSQRELPVAAIPLLFAIQQLTEGLIWLTLSSDAPLLNAGTTLYLLATTVSPLFSTHRMLKVFGGLGLISFAAAYFFYARWFISVWCFFAALLSAVIYLHFALRDRRNLASIRAKTWSTS